MNYPKFSLLKLNELDKEKLGENLKKVRNFIKNKKISMQALLLTGAIAFTAGKVNINSKPKYKISDLYVGVYTDYYGEEKLAVLLKKDSNVLNDSGELEVYYEDINGLFNSNTIKIEEVEAFFSCLSESDLDRIKKYDNELTIDCINEFMEDIESKYQLLNDRDEDESNIPKVYDINNYFIGIYYNNSLNTWVCDVFSRESTSIYSQYKKLYKASTSETDSQYATLILTTKLIENISSDDLKTVNKLGGLRETDLESIKDNINNQILSKTYIPLNNYLLSNATSNNDNNNVTTSSKNTGSYLSDLNYGIYYDNEGTKKVIIYSEKNPSILITSDGIVKGTNEFSENYKIISTDKIYNLVTSGLITNQSYQDLLNYYSLLENPLNITDLQKIAIGFSNIDLDKLTPGTKMTLTLK